MKHVLLILDGRIAMRFLQKILDTYHSNNLYIVLHKNKDFLPKEIPDTFRFYKCDYTSYFRLDNILANCDISDAFIVLEDEEESKTLYKYLRKNYKNIRVVQKIYDLEPHHEELKDKDSNLLFISQTNSLTLRLLSLMPNVPTIPRGFGLEQGEVMEIGVPSGSVFAHRQVGTIQQNNWKIIGIYRRNEFMLATSQSIIMPRDTLLMAGSPKVMHTIYNRIKSDVGQFPSPFGREIYLLLDMSLQSRDQMLYDCKEAIYIYNHLKSTRLTIRILHPNDFAVVDEIFKFNGGNISVIVDYENLNFVQSITKKFGKKIGLIVVGKELFSLKENRKILWKSKIPVFKTGKNPLSNIEYKCSMPKKDMLIHNKLKYPPQVAQSMLVVTGDEYKEYDMASVIFDISKQLQLDVKVYDFEPDNHFSNDLPQHFNAISRIFERKFTLERSNSNNPILYLQNLQKPVLHFMPFKESITKSRLTSFIKTDFESLAFMIEVNPQILLPVAE